MGRFASAASAGRLAPFVIHRTRDTPGRAREARPAELAHPDRRLVLVHGAADHSLARVVRGGSEGARRHLRPRGRGHHRRSPRVRESRALAASGAADHGGAAERAPARRPRLRRGRHARHRDRPRRAPAALHPARGRAGTTRRRRLAHGRGRGGALVGGDGPDQPRGQRRGRHRRQVLGHAGREPRSAPARLGHRADGHLGARDGLAHGPGRPRRRQPAHPPSRRRHAPGRRRPAGRTRARGQPGRVRRAGPPLQRDAGAPGGLQQRAAGESEGSDLRAGASLSRGPAHAALAEPRRAARPGRAHHGRGRPRDRHAAPLGGRTPGAPAPGPPDVGAQRRRAPPALRHRHAAHAGDTDHRPAARSHAAHAGRAGSGRRQPPGHRDRRGRAAGHRRRRPSPRRDDPAFTAPDRRLSEPAPAGRLEPPHQRRGRHAGRGSHRRRHQRARAARRAGDQRHRPRNPGRRADADLRAVLLDEGRQRPRPVHLGPDRARAPRPHRGDEPARPGQHVPRAPAGRRACVMPGVTLLVADDDPVARDLLVEVLTREGYRVQAASGGEDCVRIAQAEPCDIALVDLRMPGVDGLTALKRLVTLQPAPTVVILTAFATMETAIDAIRAGAYDYLSKPFRIDEIKMTVRRALEARRLVADNRQYRHELHERYGVDKLVGQSSEMVAIYKLVARVATLDTTILIQGETGTGKEMVARAIHYASPRADRPLVVVDCAALPEPLFESELFGHERGAFTGAVMSRRGLLETADGSTCFLDEIGDLSTTLQAKLLRVLQERVIRRVGGNDPIPVNVRLITATNQDLRKLVEDDRFREDLYYRLNSVTIRVPPLRERREDLPLLAQHFLRKYAPESGKAILGFAPGTLELPAAYPWPGNVRQLQHVVERAVALSSSGMILADDLPTEIRAETLAPPELPKTRMTLDELKRWYVNRALEETGGNKVRAAELLGIDRRTLYRILERDDAEG